MKTVIILSLMFIVNVAYANNETTSPGGEGYIQGSLIDSWEQHFSAFLLENTEVHPHDDDHISPRQGIYFKGSLNPILHAPNPHFELMLDDGTRIKGSVPHNSKVVQSAEGGIGFKKDDWRFEGVLKWNRFHIGTSRVHSVEFAALPMMHEDHDHEHEMMMPEDIVMMYRAGMNHIDNLGFLGKVFKDWSLAGLDSDGANIYLGTGYGLLRSDGTMTESDWTSIFVAETGLLIELTNSTDVQLGYEFTHYGATEDGPFMVNSYKRHSAVVGFHVYRRH